MKPITTSFIKSELFSLIFLDTNSPFLPFLQRTVTLNMTFAARSDTARKVVLMMNLADYPGPNHGFSHIEKFMHQKNNIPRK